MVQVAVAVGWHRSRQDAWETRKRIVHEGRRTSLLVDGNLHQALLRCDSWRFCSSFSECDTGPRIDVLIHCPVQSFASIRERTQYFSKQGFSDKLWRTEF
jgi:hypothetical protein